MSEWREGSCYLFIFSHCLSILVWQLEAPWQRFSPTHALSSRGVILQLRGRTQGVRPSSGGNEAAFTSTLCLFSHPPFLFHFPSADFALLRPTGSYAC